MTVAARSESPTFQKGVLDDISGTQTSQGPIDPEHDLSSLLDSIDVDTDFTVDNSHEGQHTTLVEEEKQTTMTFAEDGFSLPDLNDRWKREEIYSSFYKPSDLEQQEIERLRHWLGLNSPQQHSSLVDSISNKASQIWKSTTAGIRDGSIGKRFLKRALSAPERVAGSYLEHKADQPVSLNCVDTNSVTSLSDEMWNKLTLDQRQPVLVHHGSCFFRDKECTILLFTTGCAVAKPDELIKTAHWSEVESILKPSFTSWQIKLQQVTRQAESTAQAEDNIIDKSSAQEKEENQVTKGSDDEQLNITGFDESTWTFECEDTNQWLSILEKVVVAFNARKRSGWGWHYHILQYRPAFTMAVTNETSLLSADWQDDVHTLDQFQGWSPLHYAVKLGHENAVKVLLQEGGADPNFRDKDERTAVDHADEHSAILKLLYDFGGRKKTERLRGELFGKVEATEHVLQLKKEERQLQDEEKLKQEEAARAARAQVMENIRLINERGEKIQEMSDKATELNQGASDFRLLAQRLKEKSEKQNKWLPF